MITSTTARHFKKQIIQQHEYSTLEAPPVANEVVELKSPVNSDSSNNPEESTKEKATRGKKGWKKRNCRGQFRHEDIHLIKLGEENTSRALCKQKEVALNRIYRHLKVPPMQRNVELNLNVSGVENPSEYEELPLNLTQNNTVTDGNVGNKFVVEEVNKQNSFVSVIKKAISIKNVGGNSSEITKKGGEIVPNGTNLVVKPPPPPPPPSHVVVINNDSSVNESVIKVAPTTKSTNNNVDVRAHVQPCVLVQNLHPKCHEIRPKPVPRGDCKKDSNKIVIQQQFVQKAGANVFDQNRQHFWVVANEPNGATGGCCTQKNGSGCEKHQPPLVLPSLLPPPTQLVQKRPLKMYRTEQNFCIPNGTVNFVPNHNNGAVPNGTKRTKLSKGLGKKNPPPVEYPKILEEHQEKVLRVPYQIQIKPTVQHQTDLNVSGFYEGNHLGASVNLRQRTTVSNNIVCVQQPVMLNQPETVETVADNNGDDNNNEICTRTPPETWANSKFPFIVNSDIGDYHDGFSKCIRQVLSDTASAETYQILLNKYKMLEKDSELIEKYTQEKGRKREGEKFEELYVFLKKSFVGDIADKLIKRIEGARHRSARGCPPSPKSVANDCIDLTCDGDAEKDNNRIIWEGFYGNHPYDYFSGDVQSEFINSTAAALERITSDVFHRKDVLTPKEYSDEITFLEGNRSVPEIIKEFYKYVSKVQIRMSREPISFRVFNDLFMNNRLNKFEEDFYDYCHMRNLQVKTDVLSQYK